MLDISIYLMGLAHTFWRVFSQYIHTPMCSLDTVIYPIFSFPLFWMAV